uniref:Uncharacterized protein n=1 Tax=Arundo donax TaxID=35708 RepID=A0A0A9EJD8_ARUDO
MFPFLCPSCIHHYHSNQKEEPALNLKWAITYSYTNEVSFIS